MKRIACATLALCLLLCSCATVQNDSSKQYTATFLTLFDTVTSVVGFAESEAAFQEKAQKIHDDLLFYHQLFDIYEEYPGVTNLKTVNDQAGIAPVQVDRVIIDLLLDCKHYYTLTGGKVNVAMGSVLQLWHEAREDGIRDPMNAYLPDQTALEQAAQHTDLDRIVIDEEKSTVYITDPQMRLDVGAVAKGWAAQRVAEAAPTGMLISVGGNVCATGPKKADGTPWIIGVQNPNGNDNLHTIYLQQGAVVTSGDYQRAYTVNGTKYHHIIDPNTRMPATLWRSVSVVCADSGLADALSTALFLLPLEEGKALAQRCNAEILWINAAGEEFMTDGFREMIRT
ncbi:MAG: FAD:protein FMN transferase [Oscillospiraceae bacterium]|nr:FAD:protein FMN transferase [Oscillospiraceae bacterium]